MFYYDVFNVQRSKPHGRRVRTFCIYRHVLATDNEMPVVTMSLNTANICIYRHVLATDNAMPVVTISVSSHREP